MSKPIIGVTSFRTQSKGSYFYLSVTEAYIEAVVRAGGIPVILPLQLSETDIQDLRNQLAGLILTGGGDVDPEFYGASMDSTIGGVDPDRDRVEIALVHNAVDTQWPFLGICRGLQVINVALGGTLYTDIAEQKPGSLKHDYQRGAVYPRNMLAHPIQLDEGSRIVEMMGAAMVEVNSLHHQAVRDLASGLIPTSHAPDGILESFELPAEAHPLGVAVQWHPEWLQEHEPMRALFRSFVQSAGKVSNE